MLGDTLVATSTTCLIYKISQNRLRLVGFIKSSRSRGNCTIFSGNASQKKEVFKLMSRLTQINHQIFTIIYRMPWLFGSFIPKLGDLDSGAAGHVSSATYFSNLFEDKDRRLKIKLTLSLILPVNLRLGGYSIWSASLIAPHIKKTW
jgi:hypothetical protein